LEARAVRWLKKLIGEAEALRFKAMYDIRSNMLYVGEPPDGTDLKRKFVIWI